MLSQLPDVFDVGDTADRSRQLRCPFLPVLVKGVTNERTLLQQHTSRKAVVHVPEVNTTDPTLEVEVSVYIECLVRLNLHLPHPFRRDSTILNRRLEFVTPGTPPAVSVSVVIAA